MERVIQGVDDGLRRRLDLLETRGRRVLSTIARRRALRQALVWAAPASTVGPLLLALSAFLFPPSFVSVFLAIAAIPTAAALGYIRARRASAGPGTAALALLDHRLKLNDRLQTSDEFERLENRSAFHDAALLEAAPWIARAQDGAVAGEDGRLRLSRSRLWLWPVAGLFCLAAAFVIPQFGPDAAAPADLYPAGVTPRSSAVAAYDAASINTPAIQGSTPPAMRRGDVEASSGASQKPGAGLVAAFQNLMARLETSRGSAASARGPGAPATATPSQAAASAEGSAGRGGQGASDGGASRSGGAQDAENNQPKDGAQQTPGVTAPQDDADAAASPAASGQSVGVRQNAPSASRPQPQESGSGQPQSGEGRQPGRSRSGDQNQSGREQGGGQGENGNQSGADTGPKKGRGISSLMLATPMQDRLSGMASPGRVRTTTRDGVPQPLPATGANAQDRGTARGDAARTAPLAASAQEQRVTRDYFNARNGGGR